MQTQTSAIPDFPLFDVDDAEAAFGSDSSRYYGGTDWDEAKRPCNDLARELRAEAKAFRGLFYGGGKLEDQGFRVRPDIDKTKVHRALSALMRSFSVSSEQKEGTCALAIHHWCEPIPASSEAA